MFGRHLEEIQLIGGYVLAGGRSSRMGQDKAMLLLDGRPLVEHAVEKLKRLCATVSILANTRALESFAPIVPDNVSGYGPLGGIEAALRDSEYAWNLILPVDMPFLPTRLLDDWIWTVLRRGGWWEQKKEIRISMLSVDEQPYPTLLLIHRDVAPYLLYDLRRGHSRVRQSLESAAGKIAAERGVKTEQVFLELQWDAVRSPKERHAEEIWKNLPRRAAGFNWFVNLNTPNDFAEAQRYASELDT
jgi:molybdopterin-guanine dinucleotide biosynthesis protein A